MESTRSPVPKSTRGWLIALVATLAAAACDASPAPPTGTASASPGPWLYHREFAFVGARDGAPLVLPLAFSAIEAEERIDRSVRGALAHGDTWAGFLDDGWHTARESGVWRVLPHGGLRVGVGGPAGVEAFWYRRGERRVRLGLTGPLSGWHGGQRTRYRLHRARLQVGGEATPGTVVEEMSVRRSGVTLEPGAGRDRVLVVAGDSLRLLLGDAGLAVLSVGRTERAWDDARVEWLERGLRAPHPEPIPVRWRFALPEAGIAGELEALGHALWPGASGQPRRAAALLSVRGWLEVEGERLEVVGVVRHPLD